MTTRGRGLVIGGSSGIGAAVASHMTAAGWETAVASRRGTAPPEATRAHQCDIRSSASVAEMFAAASDNGLDWVVNAAGVGYYAPFESRFADQWQDILDTNVVGLLNVLGALRDSRVRHFVQIGSLASRRPSRTPGNHVYAAAKTAVAQILERYREELRAQDIKTRITLVTPGYVGDTGFAESFFTHSPESETPLLSRFTPLTPDEVAEAVAYALNSPPSVEVSEIVLRPVDQPD